MPKNDSSSKSVRLHRVRTDPLFYTVLSLIGATYVALIMMMLVADAVYVFTSDMRKYVILDFAVDGNDEFDAFSQFYLGWSRFRGLLRVPLEELNGISLRVVLSRTYNMPTLHFDQRLQCAPLLPVACKTLGLSAGSPGMIWEIFGRTYRRQPASYQRVYLPMGHRPIEITSSL